MGDVKLNSSGGGSVTLTTPSTASNLTVTLPSTSGTLLNTGATSFTFAGAGTISATTTLTLNGGAGSNGLVLDASNNVGIGTSSPGYKLDVFNSGGTAIAVGASTGKIYLYGDNSGTTVGTTSAIPLRFATNSTEQMRLDASGNLGLGVTPSGWGSSYKAFESNGVALMSSPATAGGWLIENAYYNGSSFIYKQTAGAAMYRQLASEHTWWNAASGAAGTGFSFTQAMTLTASGSLLVGATSGGARFEATAVSGQYAGYFSFPSSGYGIGVKNTSGGSGVLAYFFSPNYVGEINTNGTTTTYASASDQRLKTNVTPAGSAIQSILDFPVDQFDWISSGEHQDFGAVAQKAINVIPEMVSVPADPDEMWGIDWSKAVPRLIKTIQELSAKNSELESRLAALEGK